MTEEQKEEARKHFRGGLIRAMLAESEREVVKRKKVIEAMKKIDGTVKHALSHLPMPYKLGSELAEAYMRGMLQGAATSLTVYDKEVLSPALDRKRLTGHALDTHLLSLSDQYLSDVPTTDGGQE
jgi:hypothetical protein